MYYTVYRWVINAPGMRPGGPWWYDIFASKKERDEWIETFLPTCCKMFVTETEEKPQHDPMKIAPPEGAEEIECPNAHLHKGGFKTCL